jgi:hypothetical protein
MPSTEAQATLERIAETLARIETTVLLVADRYADNPRVQEAADIFLAFRSPQAPPPALHPVGRPELEETLREAA